MLLGLIEAAARAVTRVALSLLAGAVVVLLLIASMDRIVAAVTGGA